MVLNDHDSMACGIPIMGWQLLKKLFVLPIFGLNFNDFI